MILCKRNELGQKWFQRRWAADVVAVTVFALAACAGASPPPGDPGPDAAAVEEVDARPPATDGVRLPFAVDDYFVPSGYMGDGAAGGIDQAEQCAATRPGEGRGRCHEFTWTPGASGWAGVFWQFPENSWGEVPGLPIAQGATAVELYAWGARGGEEVTFVVGMDDVDGFHAEVEVELSAQPAKVTIDLAGQTYTDVTGGFGWVASGDPSGGLTFFVDDVQWK